MVFIKKKKKLLARTITNVRLRMLFNIIYSDLEGVSH